LTTFTANAEKVFECCAASSLADQARNERANQIARAGFIRRLTDDLQGRNHHVINER